MTDSARSKNSSLDESSPPHRPDRNDFRDTQSLELPFAPTAISFDRKTELLRMRDEAVNGSAAQRTDFLLNHVFVRTPDVMHVLGVVQQLFSLAGMFANPGGLRIVADSGMGKDALLRCLLNTYPAQPDAAQPRYPLVYVSFRERLAPGQILRSLLRQMHCSYSGNQLVDELEDNLIAAIDKCDTFGFVFNEAHHMLSVRKNTKRIQVRISGEAGDWLKGFLDRVKRPFIFLGIPGWDEVFDLDPQLRSRVPNRYVISPFAFDSTFIGILRVLDEAIPMPEPAGLAEINLAQSLYSVCNGIWRPLIFLLRDAIVYATRRQSRRIERCDLHLAFQLQHGSKVSLFA